MFDKQFGRPSNYFTLSGREQWAIDAALGILDWPTEGQFHMQLTAAHVARLRAHYDAPTGGWPEP